MALDTITIHFLTEELKNALTDARIEKVHQPEKDEILLMLKTYTNNYRLVISANASQPRIHFTQVQKENPKTAPIIEALWSVFKADKHYNTNVKLLQRAMKLDRDERELFVDIDINEFKSAEQDDRAFGWLTEFLQFLKNNGIIDFWGTQNNKISFAFNNSTAKELFGKSGNVLEMKVFKVAKDIKAQNGVPYYTDSKRSVIIDWDGKLGNNKTGDTKNEIDCVLMKNLIPVFISCKGGDIEEAELYKLDAVANRFGGKYAKKVLISTNHGKDEISAAYFRKRAQDMNITLFENVHLFTDSEFFDMIKELA